MRFVEELTFLIKTTNNLYISFFQISDPFTLRADFVGMKNR